MSRTYRRKGAEYENSWLLIDYVQTGFITVTRYWSHTDKEHKEYISTIYTEVHIDPKSIKGREKLAMFHSDKRCTMNQVPSWYKKEFCRRPFRKKEKQALNKVRKLELWDFDEVEINFPKPVKDALYYW